MFESVSEVPGPAAASHRLDPAALAGLSKADRLAVLRDRIAAVPARVERTAAPTMPTHDVIAVPGPLGELLPGGGLPRGSVVSCPRGSALLALLAAATGTGRFAAVVTDTGSLQLGLLAAWEHNVRLHHLAVVQAGAGSAAEVVSVLVDGVELVVMDVAGVRMKPVDQEKLRARVRTTRAVLVLASGADWVRRPHLQLDVRIAGMDGIGQGSGRLRRIALDVRVTAQGNVAGRGRLVLDGADDGRMRWTRADRAAGGGSRLSRTG